LSQDAFAKKFGLSAATLRDWEQGRRQMDRTAQAFLKVIDRAPDAVEKALKAA
jgi:putative transcriptional regulator